VPGKRWPGQLHDSSVQGGSQLCLGKGINERKSGNVSVKDFAC